MKRKNKLNHINSKGRILTFGRTVLYAEEILGCKNKDLGGLISTTTSPNDWAALEGYMSLFNR